MLRTRNKYWQIAQGIALVCLCWVLGTQPVSARFQQHGDGTGAKYIHVRHSLKDYQGLAWQVVLFEKDQRFILRLVGFPGRVILVHPEPLRLFSPEGSPLLTAPDLFTQAAPAENVGQYDITDIFPRLSEHATWQAEVPLDRQVLTLDFPAAVVSEWIWFRESHNASF
ncbi:MAG: DUF3122 domain-containing protein [Cyanobacteria bacterium P01_H01_bin.15]